MGDVQDRSTNLARVRDNQRRSRARRKEYLNDLESKYRNCEQVGIEASAEIQQAARRVVEENKRLRGLLRRMGVSEAEMNGANGEDAGRVLEGMLGVRWECGSACGEKGSRDGVSPVASSTSHYEPSPQHVPIAAALERLQTQTQNQSSSTSGTSSGMHTPSSGEWQAPPLAPQHPPTSTPSQDHQQPTAFYTPTSAPNHNFYTPPPMDQPFYQSYPQDYSISDSDLASFGTQTQFDSASCRDVAGAIRSIRPDMGSELESELGCGQDGRDCNVSNARAFDLLDRFSERLNAL